MTTGDAKRAAMVVADIRGLLEDLPTDFDSREMRERADKLRRLLEAEADWFEALTAERLDEPKGEL